MTLKRKLALALFALLVPAASAQTLTPFEFTAPLRPDYVASAPGDKFIRANDLDGAYLISVTPSGSSYVIAYQAADNTLGSVTITPGTTGGGGSSVSAGTTAPSGGDSGDLYIQVSALGAVQSFWLNSGGTWQQYSLPAAGLSSVATQVPVSGDGTSGNPVTIGANAITSGHINDVAANKITGTINTARLPDANALDSELPTVAAGTGISVTQSGTAYTVASTVTDTNDGVVTGGSFSGSTLTLTRSQGLSAVQVSGIGGSGMGGEHDGVVSGGSVSGTTLTLQRTEGLGDVTITGLPGGTVSSDSTLTGDGSGGSPLGIADNGVTTAKILDGSVTSADIANSTIVALDIASDAITQDKIRDDSVGSGEIIENSINTNHILANAVESVDILNNTITAADIAANAVGSSEIAADAVGNSEMADNAVGFNEMADDAVGMRELRTDTNTPAHLDILIWDANDNRLEWRDDTHILLPIAVPPSGFITLEPGQAARYRGRIVWNGSTTNATNVNESTIDAIIRDGQLIYISSDLGVLTGNRTLSNVVIGDKFVADGVSYVVTANRAALFTRANLPALVADGTLQRLDVSANPSVGSDPTRLRTLGVDGTSFEVESITYPADGASSLPIATAADWDSSGARSKAIGFLDNKLWTVTRALTPGHSASATWTPVPNNTTFSADGATYRWRGFHSNRPGNPQEFDFYWDTDDDFLHIRINTGGVGFWVRQNQYNFLQQAMNLVIGLPFNYFTTQADALAHIHQNGQRAVYLDTNGNRVLATVSAFSPAAGSQYSYEWTEFIASLEINPPARSNQGQVLRIKSGDRVYDAAAVRLPVSGSLAAPTADDYDATSRQSRYLGWDGTLQEVDRSLDGVHSADATFTLVAGGTNFGPYDGRTYRYRGAFGSVTQVGSPQANDFYFDTGYLELYLCSDIGGTTCAWGNIATSGLTSRLVSDIGYLAHESTYSGALGIVSANGQTLAIDKMPWPAKGEILVSGTVGTQIPLGTQVQTSGGVVFQTYEAGAVPSSGSVTLDARAVLGGTDGNIADNTALALVAAISGVTGITADGAFAGGDDITGGWGLYTVSGYQAADAGHYSYSWIPVIDANSGLATTAGQLRELRVGDQVYDTAGLRLPVDGSITLPSSSDWSDQYGRSRHVWFDGRHLFRVVKIRNEVTTAPSATFTAVPEFTTLNVATTSTNFRWRRTHWQDNLVSNPQRWDLYAQRPDFRLRYYDGTRWADLALTGSFNGHSYRGWWDDQAEALDHVSANSQYVGYGFELYQVSDYDDGTGVAYTYDFENLLPEGVVLDPSDASLLDHLHEREPRDVNVTFAPLETDGHYRGWSTIGPGNGSISEAPPSDSDILEIGFVDPNYSFTSFFGLDSGFLGHLTLVVDEGPDENQYEGARLRFKGVEFTFHEAPYDNNNNRGRYLSNTFVRLADQPARNAQGAFNVENVHAEDLALGGTAWLWHTMRASPAGSDEPALTESDVKVFVPTTGRGIRVGDMDSESATTGQYPAATGTGGGVEWRTLPTGGGQGLSAVSSDSTLSGDGTSGSPLGIAAGGVGATQLAVNSVSTTHVVNNSLTQADLANNSVGSGELSGNAVTLSKISPAGSTDGQVLTSTGPSSTPAWEAPAAGGLAAVSSDATLSGNGTSGNPLGLADNAVTEPKLANNAVTGAKLASNSVTGPKLAGDSVTGAKIDDGTITLSDLQTTNLNNLNFRPLQWDGTNFRVGTLAQNTLANSVTERLLPAGGDDEECLRKSADGNYDVEWAACGTGGGDLSSVTIASPGALEGNGTSGSPLDVRDSGITTTHIQNGTVTGFDVQDGTLLGGDLANRTVTPAKVNPSGSTDGQVLTSTGPSSDPQWETLSGGGTISGSTIEVIANSDIVYADSGNSRRVALNKTGVGNGVGTIVFFQYSDSDFSPASQEIYVAANPSSLTDSSYVRIKMFRQGQSSLQNMTLGDITRYNLYMLYRAGSFWHLVAGTQSEPHAILPTGGSDGQVLTKTSGTNFATAWETPTGGGGGLTTVATGSSIDGDGTSGSPLRIADDSINSALVADGTLTTADILDGSITSGDIANGTIAALDIANDAVTLPKISTTGSTSGQLLRSTGPSSDPVWGSSLADHDRVYQYLATTDYGVIYDTGDTDLVLNIDSGFVDDTGTLTAFHYFSDPAPANQADYEVQVRIGNSGTEYPLFWLEGDVFRQMEAGDIVTDYSYLMIRRSTRYELIQMVASTPDHQIYASGSADDGDVLTADGDGGSAWEAPDFPDSMGGFITGGNISVNELYGNDGWTGFSSHGVTSTTTSIGPVYSAFKAGVYRLVWTEDPDAADDDNNLCVHKHTSAPANLITALDNQAFRMDDSGENVFAIAANEFLWFRNCATAEASTDVSLTIQGY